MLWFVNTLSVFIDYGVKVLFYVASECVFWWIKTLHCMQCIHYVQHRFRLTLHVTLAYSTLCTTSLKTYLTLHVTLVYGTLRTTSLKTELTLHAILSHHVPRSFSITRSFSDAQTTYYFHQHVKKDVRAISVICAMAGLCYFCWSLGNFVIFSREGLLK